MSPDRLSVFFVLILSTDHDLACRGHLGSFPYDNAGLSNSPLLRFQRRADSLRGMQLF